MRIRSLCSVVSAALFAFSAAHAAESGTMRAAVIVDGTLKMDTVPIPEPGPGQVRVRVHATSVNPADWKVAARAAPGSREIGGRDFAGVIDAVGEGVNEGAVRWKKGDAVIGVTTTGAYSDYAIASAKAIAAKPTNMSFEEAAGIPIVGESAWRSLVTVGNVQKGQRVLIHGGAGGVGSSAVQVGKALGAYVIATASARNHEFLRSLGADEIIDYTTTRFEDKVRNVDLVLNTANMETNLRSVGVVKRGGVLVSIVGPPPADACEKAGIRCAVIGRVNGELLSNLVELANAGKYRITIDRLMPLSDAAKAWEISREGHVRGKIVLQVSPGAT